jgi:hypothetical protein
MPGHSQNKTSNDDKKIKLLGAAGLIRKVQEGISTEELYRETSRKFDTLVELMSDIHGNNSMLRVFGFNIDGLRQNSLLLFDRLISNKNSNPYITLCVSKDASIEEINRRRKKLLQIFHPDKHRISDTNEIKTRRINEAYEKIININFETRVSSDNLNSDSARRKLFRNANQYDTYTTPFYKEERKHNFLHTILPNRFIWLRKRNGIISMMFILFSLFCSLIIYFLFFL